MSRDSHSTAQPLEDGSNNLFINGTILGQAMLPDDIRGGSGCLPSVQPQAKSIITAIARSLHVLKTMMVSVLVQLRTTPAT